MQVWALGLGIAVALLKFNRFLAAMVPTGGSHRLFRLFESNQGVRNEGYSFRSFARSSGNRSGLAAG
jgi:hypothetical protein